MATPPSKKALHDERRKAERCIYDRRDRGGPACGPVFKGGRCEGHWTAKLLSGKKRRREKQLGHWRAKLRGAKDPMFIEHCKRRVAALTRELQDILCQLEHGGDPPPTCPERREAA